MDERVERVVAEMPFETRAQALEEGERDPAFWPRFSTLALRPDGARAVDEDMRRAVLSEVGPGGSRPADARWPMLRAKVREVVAEVGAHFAARGNLDGLADLAQAAGGDVWSMIGAALATAGKAASDIYARRQQQSVQKASDRAQAMIDEARARAAAAPRPEGAGRAIVYALLGLLGVGMLVLIYQLVRRH